jgi:hypothetical protein
MFERASLTDRAIKVEYYWYVVLGLATKKDYSAGLTVMGQIEAQGIPVKAMRHHLQIKIMN